MKALIEKVISSASDFSSKRLLMIYLAVLLGFSTVWATVMGDWVFSIITLSGMILALAGINSGENRKKMTLDKHKENG